MANKELKSSIKKQSFPFCRLSSPSIGVAAPQLNNPLMTQTCSNLGPLVRDIIIIEEAC